MIKCSNFFKVVTKFGLSLMLTGVIALPVNAHLMLAQHGTVNIVNNDAYMVLSLPIGIFKSIDDNNDGDISMIEFNNNRKLISKKIKSQVYLMSEAHIFPLQDVLLSPTFENNEVDTHVLQLTLMGKAIITDLNADKYYIHANLFGTTPAQQVLEITATNKQMKQKNTFLLTPKVPVNLLFN